LLQAARQHGWQVRRLDLRNSGDTSGDRSRVVGYGAYGFY
ncbi:MAG: AmmeMemoRadiSam system protein B, partial [Gammaproteobacteria bacterium]|nr:AmmeMemoRadiSam system protein B [Gammaproteobacteria bacterium]